MKINKAYRYELKPNIQQRVLLAKHAGAARFTYNWALQKRIDLYSQEKKSTNAIEQHRLINHLKATEFPWMYEVSKCAPQEALRDLDKAFRNFFRNIQKGVKPGFPKFKKKGIRDSFRLTGTIKINETSTQLPKLGAIRIKEKPAVQGRILSATISRQADRWYVSFTVEQQIEQPLPVQGSPLGIDLGIISFVTTSTGTKISPPKPLNKAMRRLKLLSKQHSQKQKGSKNRKKSAFKLARQHRKIGNQRCDFQHKLSTKLAKTTPVIVVEDLCIKEMMQNKRLSRQIADMGWSGFIRMLEYKTKWYGSKLIKAPRYYASTKRCSCCHHIAEVIPLNIRTWECTQCNIEHDRDVNAAMNLLNLYTGSSPEINACGDSSGGADLQSASYVSLKQEVINGIFVHKL
jgi:putative transposase